MTDLTTLPDRASTMIGMTMCSGIGAPEMAAPWIDWRFAAEIEPFPRAVLQERFGYRLPEDHNQGEPLLWGDMTEVTPDLLQRRGIPLPDLIVAGTPCQSFSVAGLRKGTSDARGNLTLKFVEICHAIQSARPDGKLAVLWENVPGVLSDKGNAFGCFLGGLIGADDALSPPAGESWPGAGMVSGPRARAAWRVLDAKHFGVPQRRRRVFVVVDFGNALDPAEVLFERKGLRGDTPPSGQTGQTAPPPPARSSGGGGLGTDFDCDGRLIVSTGDVAHCLNAGGMGRQDYETETMIAHTLLAREGDAHAADLQTYIAHTLRGEGFDASEDGTGRGTPLVPVVAGAICRDSFSGGAGGRPEGAAAGHFIPVPVAFDCKGTEVQFTEGGTHPPLRSMGHSQSHQNAGGHAAVAIQERAPQAAATPWAVRRLTPVETARLQGFPDDHTAIIYRGKPAADGPQYKSHGNSMALPCIAWIIDRMADSMEAR